MEYNPQKSDLDNIDLPDELIRLRESLAENVHDAWAAQRIEDGWTYGKIRDDSLKTHPGLVRYSDLSESEKEYDRITAEITIKSIISNGYCIISKSKMD